MPQIQTHIVVTRRRANSFLVAKQGKKNEMLRSKSSESIHHGNVVSLFFIVFHILICHASPSDCYFKLGALVPSLSYARSRIRCRFVSDSRKSRKCKLGKVPSINDTMTNATFVRHCHQQRNKNGSTHTHTFFMCEWRNVRTEGKNDTFRTRIETNDGKKVYHFEIWYSRHHHHHYPHHSIRME